MLKSWPIKHLQTASNATSYSVLSAALIPEPTPQPTPTPTPYTQGTLSTVYPNLQTTDTSVANSLSYDVDTSGPQVTITLNGYFGSIGDTVIPASFTQGFTYTDAVYELVPETHVTATGFATPGVVGTFDDVIADVNAANNGIPAAATLITGEAVCSSPGAFCYIFGGIVISGNYHTLPQFNNIDFDNTVPNGLRLNVKSDSSSTHYTVVE